jgi:hypothetical protein
VRLNKVKRWWQNGSKIWIWYLLGLAAVTIIAKASNFIADSKRYEPRIQKLEEYREKDIKFTAEVKKDIEYIKEGVDEIKDKLNE